MVLGPKTRRYLRVRDNPTAAILEQLSEMEGIVKSQASAESERIVGTLERKAYARIQRIAGIVEVGLRQILQNADSEIQKQVQEKIDAMPQIKGDAGYSPVKGKDYFDGHPGENGYTPVADVDYPSTASLERMIADAMIAFYHKLEQDGLTAKQIRSEMQLMFKDIPAENIARAIEGLSGSRRLSYKALKDTPSQEVGHTQHTLHRGGGVGKQTYYYDLSSLCDDVTKTFAIPSNTRVVQVRCTDAPAGILRQTIDWTGSGTTVLTLDAAFAAPSTGATLDLLYVV